MNYKWNIIKNLNKESANFYGIFETAISNIKTRVYISVTPTLKNFGSQRLCFSHIYFEASNEEITDSLFHSVSDDIYFLLSRNLKPFDNLFKIALIEYYCVDKIPNNIAFTSGDYSFEGLD